MPVHDSTCYWFLEWKYSAIEVNGEIGFYCQSHEMLLMARILMDVV